ncbi:hypothetical protein GPECTOR_22g771 [Gonium pectorale]|uniref:Core domain-containing protein n=1 Tax=Gonium pectorale TaxID=33097 RepID=A0A150GH58_GONPE|nr:hypothetical protein GPECTOR_22g771 [Gonium pectorale]|eukprot:KXZ49181.1 hypothetical protein GPECTOR_22g771 [Gonium pectorale]
MGTGQVGGEKGAGEAAAAPAGPHGRYPVESALKAVGGFLLFILQITYGGYKGLHCEDGSPRAGRLVTQHLNSWAHASMNLGFSLSGLVELLGLHSRLPDGLNLVVLSGAFFIEAMLFSLHEKNGHLDQTIHWLLAQACWAGAIFAGLEAAWPESFLLTAGRVGSLLLQGTWFWQTARVLFDGLLQWDDNYNGHEDEAPAMFLPMIFVYHMLVLMAFMVAVYAALEGLHKRLVPNGGHANEPGPSHGGYETSRLLSEDDNGQHELGMKSVPLSTLSGGCSGMSYVMDFESQDKVTPDDHVMSYEDGFRLVVDPKSLLYLFGMRLGHSSALIGGGFQFHNPNATDSCGCGKSFGV